MQNVVAGIMVHRGRFLIGKRGPACGDRQGLLQYPGGKVEPGELFDKAVAREFFQETGFAVAGVHKLCSSILIKPNGKQQRCTFFLIIPVGTVTVTKRMLDRWEKKEKRPLKPAVIEVSPGTITIDFPSPKEERDKCPGWSLVNLNRLYELQTKLVDKAMLSAASQAQLAYTTACLFLKKEISRVKNPRTH